LLGAIKITAQAAFDEQIRAESGVGEQFRPTHGDPEDWYDQSAAGNWTSLQVNREDKPVAPIVPAPAQVYSPMLLQWSVAPVEIRSQLGVAPTAVSMRSMLASQALLAPDTQVVRAAPNVIQNARMSRFAMTAQPVAQTMDIRQIDPAIFAAINVQQRQQPNRRFILQNTLQLDDVAPVPPSPAPPPPPQPPVSSNAFSISVDISIVKLRRPWLSDGLLNLGGWFVPSATKASFSDGTGASGQGLMPVLPVACVLIRNLSVHAEWSEDDQKNLENSTHLGAFGLLGRSYDRNSATLTVPGMQTVAWICDPFPVLPPADAPAS